MAWLAAVDATNTITSAKRYIVERTIYIGSGDVYKRTITVVPTAYVGLTKAYAEEYAAAHVTDSGIESMVAERVDDADQWRVVAEVWTYGAWAKVT